MSGTSGDGIDAVVARVPREDAARATVLAHRHVDFEPAFRARVLALPAAAPPELALMHAELGRRFGDAASAAMREAGLRPEQVDAVASAGLTVAHIPPGPEGEGATLALGDGDAIAARCGCDVLSDFRAADRAAGGQGAPLVPFADALLLRPRARAVGAPVAALNLGGIANLTLVPPEGDPLAFDTGPGNMLLDGAIARATRGELGFDRDGALGRGGRVDVAWLAALLDEDGFLGEPPPKSTGRERYGAAWLDAHAAQLEARALPDVAATLAAFTVEAVARALEELAPCGARARGARAPSGGAGGARTPVGPEVSARLMAPAELIVSGGGAFNPCLMDGLRRRLPRLRVHDSAAALGVPPLAREALAFALIADATLRGEPSNVPSVTGARRPCLLGKLSRAPLAR